MQGFLLTFRAFCSIIPYGILTKGVIMNKEALKLLADINNAIIKFRGIYSAWSKKNGITYNEMLVLYTIRDSGYCTQKQICDSYLLPRQTINHVILDMEKRGILEVAKELGAGREKVFVLTEDGKKYAEPLLDSLNNFEAQAIENIGHDTLRTLAEGVMAYDEALSRALDEVK